MTRWHPVAAAAALIGLTLALFEVRLDPQFRLPGTITEPEPGREARYAACFEARDAAIHEQAFATIDNPNVQREYIAAHRERAKRDCRALYPRVDTTVEVPMRVNLLDFDFRFD